jgi:O-acetylhomoserine (thiol)-lyase
MMVAHWGLCDGRVSLKGAWYKYMPKDAGAMFAFGVKGGMRPIRLENMRLFTHLVNIGDTRSLTLPSASKIRQQLTDEQRLAAGAGRM